ncbi:hypothetical protein CCP1ISM_930004 [Azospirillaceae bacterium]
MSHLEIDYELLIKDLSKIRKDKRDWFYVIGFIDKWLRNKKISVKSTNEVVKIIRSIKPKLIPKKKWLSPGVSIKEIDHSSWKASLSIKSMSVVESKSKGKINNVKAFINKHDLQKLIGQPYANS